MIKRNKKGFTIVELVIVIAIVAILAAVLIPTFSSIIERANDSSDIQTVRQLNTAVAAEAAEKGRPLTYNELLDVLEDYDFTLENLTPAGKDNQFYWYKDKNIFILVDKADGGWELIYPVEDSNGPIDISEILDDNGKIQKDEDGQDIIIAIGGQSGGTGSSTPTGKKILTLADLKNALANGENCYLADDIKIAEAITIESNVTLDLNGNMLTVKTLKNNGELNISGGSLVVTNTTEEVALVNTENEVEADNYYGILNSEGATLNFTDCKISVSGKYTSVEQYNEELGYDETIHPGSGIYNLGSFTINNRNSEAVTIEIVTAENGIYNEGSFSITGNTFVSIKGSVEYGILNVDTFTASGDTTVSIIESSFDFGICNKGVLTLENKSTAIETSGYYSICLGNYRSAGISNLNVVASGMSSYGFFNLDGEANIKNAVIAVTGTDAYGIENYDKVYITGSTIKAAKDDNTKIDTEISALVSNMYGEMYIADSTILANADGYSYSNDAPIINIGNIGTITIDSKEKVTTITSNKYCTYTNGGRIVITDTCELTHVEGCGYNLCGTGSHGTDGCAHFTYKKSLEDKFKEICESATEGTLTLDKDAEFGNSSSHTPFDATIPAGASVTIDLNGHELVLYTPTFSIAGELKFIDSSTGTSGKISVTHMNGTSGSFNIEGDGTLSILNEIEIEASFADDFNYLLNFFVSNSKHTVENSTMTLPENAWEVDINTNKTTVGVSLGSDIIWYTPCTIPSGRTVTINTNGCRLEVDTQNLFSTQNEGNLIITDSSTDKTGTIIMGPAMPFNVSAGCVVSLVELRIEAAQDLLNEFVKNDSITIKNCIVSGDGSIGINKSEDTITEITLTSNEYTLPLTLSIPNGKTLIVEVPAGKTLTIPSNATVNGTLTIKGEGTVKTPSATPFKISGTVSISNVTINGSTSSIVYNLINYFIGQDNIRIENCKLVYNSNYYGTLYKADANKVTMKIMKNMALGDPSHAELSIPAGKQFAVEVDDNVKLTLKDVLINISGQMSIAGVGTILIDDDYYSTETFNIIDGGSLSFTNITICAISNILSDIQNDSQITCTNCTFTNLE